MSKHFSIIVIPESSNRVKRLHISSGIIKSAVCGGVIASALFVFFAYSYFGYSVDRDELQRLRVVTSQQRQTLHGLVADLDEVHQQMNSLQETEARVRQLAKLENVAKDIPIAIGGIAEVSSVAAVGKVQSQINNLQVAIELRRKSQEGVRNLLNDQVSLHRATPKGWPTKGWVTSYFGMRDSPFTGKRVMHEGLDIAANIGTPVFATADGVVARVKYSAGYGKMIIIDHGYGYRTIFAHNSKIVAKAGQRIKRGDLIAKVGNTGQSTGSHLHYELQLNGVPIDPRKTL